jgi:tetratricopeptide (TPR) repeat protein
MKRSVLSAPARRSSITLPMVAFLLATVAFMSAPGTGDAGADDAVTLGFDTRATYAPGPGDSRTEARNLAFFRAKRKAVLMAADRFEHQRLIQFVDRDKNELVHMVADALTPESLEDTCRDVHDGAVCTVRLHTVVRLSDFIDAQLASLRLGADEDTADYRHEMEPSVPVPLRPGKALAKAYRLIHKNELRMAIIYLDRLADQYPNWWEIYEIKALALRLQDQPARMLEALRKACELGSPTACAELK